MKLRSTGFSLVEVVVALGLVALGAIVFVAWLGPLTRSSQEQADQQRADQLIDDVQYELERWREARMEFTRIARLEAIEALAREGSLRLVADRIGSELRLVGDGDARGYFHLTVQPLPAVEGTVGSRGGLALQVRAQWPFPSRAGDGPTTAERTLVQEIFLRP